MGDRLGTPGAVGFLKFFQSEATLSLASTWMGDRLGTPGAVGFKKNFKVKQH